MCILEKMKKLFISLALLTLTAASVAAFSDVYNTPYEEAIETLKSEGIVQGYADGTFRPEAAINRAEFTKVLIEARYPGEAEGSHCFSDVSTQWYAAPICFAEELSIVSGHPDGRFKPGDTINLAEALKIILETYEVDVCTDCAGLWYQPYLEAAEERGLLDGLTKAPSHPLTRGEMAQLIYALLDENAACEEQLFGFWGLNGTFEGDVAANLAALQNQTGLNSFVVSTSPSYTLNTQLPALRETGLSASFRMSGGNDKLIDSHGNFDLDAWEDLFESWTSHSELNSYIGEELQWHMLLDDVDTFDNQFGGKNPTADELEALAKISKEAFPDLKTFLRHDADDMPSGTYPFLDATLNQYSARKGSLEDYIESNLEAADELGLETIWGLNIVDGGNGSSGHPGSSWDRSIMSPEEIEAYGEALLALPSSLGLLMWEFDADQELADGVTSAERFSTDDYLEVFKKLAAKVSCSNN